MELCVPRVVQRPQECEPACLAMVLAHGGVSIDMDALIQETATPRKYKDWEYLHGVAALRRGLRAYIVTRDPLLYDPSWAPLAPAQWVNRFRRRVEWVREETAAGRGEAFPWFFEAAHETALGFLDAGGEVVLRAPSLPLIAAVLSGGVPVIAPIQGALFYGDRFHQRHQDEIRGMPYGHVVVLAGWAGAAGTVSRLLVVDPSADSKVSGGRSWEDADEILYANLIYMAPLLLVSAKPIAFPPDHASHERPRSADASRTTMGEALEDPAGIASLATGSL